MKVDNIGQLQLQQQINKIKQDIEQQQQEQKKFFYNIHSILYSGNNFDQYGNEVINPAINSTTKFIKHQNKTEQIMSIGVISGWWQSLTYPGEYVYLVGDQIKQRYDGIKSFYADFDYRFYPVKQVPQIDFEIIFNNKKQKINTPILDEKIYKNGFDKIVYNMSQDIKDEFKRNISNIFEKLDIFIGMSSEDQNKYHDSTKILITTYFDLNTLLVQAQQINQLIELTNLQTPLNEEIKQNLMNFTFSKTKFTYDPLNFTEQINILENAIQNIYIKNSINVYLNPLEQHINIHIQDSENVQLFGNQNVYLKKCKNIILGNSTEEGRIDLINIQNFYTEDMFCNNNGQFMFYNTDQQSESFTIIGKDCFKTARIIQSGLLECETVIKALSFNYSQGTIVNLLKSQIMVEYGALRYTNINIKDSFYKGYLHLTNYSCANGKIQVGPDSFNINENNPGIMSFLSPEYLKQNRWQSIVCPENLHMFYMNKVFQDLNILKGSEIIIENAICYINNDELKYDNGPFNLPQIMENIRENQYLQTELPQTKYDPEFSSWYGYYMTSLETQSFDNWAQLPLSQQTIITDSIRLKYLNESKDYDIYSKTYEEGILKLVVKNVDSSIQSVEKIQLTVDQSYTKIQVNGVDVSFENCEYDIFVEDDCDITFDSLVKGIKLRASDSVINLGLSTGMSGKLNLEYFDIPIDLIKKTTNPSNYLFNLCTKFNPIDFVLNLPIYSEYLFQGCDFSSYQVENITFNKQIPRYCFWSTKWNVSNSFIFETNVLGYECFLECLGPPTYIFKQSVQHDVGGRQFIHSLQLQHINFESENVEIDNSMFRNCQNLTTVSGIIKQINSYGFDLCKELITIDLSQCVSIGEYGLQQTKLNELNLNSIQQLGNSCFASCDQLINVNINILNFNKIIPQQAFSNCMLLESVYFENIPYNGALITLYDSAFYNCDFLKNISGSLFDQLRFIINGQNVFKNTSLYFIDIQQMINGNGVLQGNSSAHLEVKYYGDTYNGEFQKIGDKGCRTVLKVIDGNVFNQIQQKIDEDHDQIYYKHTQVERFY